MCVYVCMYVCMCVCTYVYMQMCVTLYVCNKKKLKCFFCVRSACNVKCTHPYLRRYVFYACMYVRMYDMSGAWKCCTRRHIFTNDTIDFKNSDCKVNLFNIYNSSLLYKKIHNVLYALQKSSVISSKSR